MQRKYMKSLLDDGINEEFFDLLWTKDDLKFSPIINIPDTIVFKQGLPTKWYFTSIEGRIKRKNKQNLINIQIEEAFLKKSLGYDVIATFINIPVDKDEKTNELPPCTIEYLTKDNLIHLLSTKDRDKHGILQRFIYPKGTKNDTIRVVWSPRICLLERLENIYHLHDQRYGLYERCVTYEGPEYFYTAIPLKGPVLTGQIQKICESIASHISEITNELKQLSRAVFTFKVDSKDKVWLLYTTSVRSKTNLFNSSTDSPSMTVDNDSSENQLVNINSILQIPSNIILNPLKTIDKPVIKYPTNCLSCNNSHFDEERYPITYKIIIKHYEHVIQFMKELYNIQSKNNELDIQSNQRVISHLNQPLIWPPTDEIIEITGGIGFGCLKIIKTSNDNISNEELLSDIDIPILIHYLHPNITYSIYQQCYHDPLFLFKSIHVCEKCCLKYLEFATIILRLGSDIKKLVTSDSISSVYLHEDKYLNKSNSLNQFTSQLNINIDMNNNYNNKPNNQLESTSLLQSNSTSLLTPSISLNYDKPKLPDRITNENSLLEYNQYINNQFIKENNNYDDLNNIYIDKLSISSNDLTNASVNLSNSITNHKINAIYKKYNKINEEIDRYKLTLTPIDESIKQQRKYDIYQKEIPYIYHGQMVYSSKLKKANKLNKSMINKNISLIKESINSYDGNIIVNKLDSVIDNQIDSPLESTNNIDSKVDSEVDRIKPNVNIYNKISKSAQYHLDFLKQALKSIELEDIEMESYILKKDVSKTDVDESNIVIKSNDENNNNNEMSDVIDK